MDTPKAEAQTLADMRMQRGRQSEVGFSVLQTEYNRDTQRLISRSKANSLLEANFGNNDYKRLKDAIQEIESIKDKTAIGVLTKDNNFKSHPIFLNYSKTIQDLIEELNTEYTQISSSFSKSINDINTLKEFFPIWKQQEIDKRIAFLKGKMEGMLQASTCLPTIVWARPGKDFKEGKKVDAYIYSGKTSDKTVHLPFSDIHRKLIEANWIMHASERVGAGNYLVAHLAFVVSSGLHPIRKRLKVDEEYTGKRMFVDFPFTIPASILASLKTFATEEAYKNYVNSYREGEMVFVTGDEKFKYEGHGFRVGMYYGSKTVYAADSEDALIEFLQKANTIQGIVSILKSKLLYLHGSLQNSDEGFKVYAANLFINSQRNVCNACETRLAKLMTPETSTFLASLNKELQEQGFLIPKKHKGLRLSISVSCYDMSIGTFKRRLHNDAINANEKLEPTYIDIKQLAGTAILSVPEKYITGKDAWRYSEELKGKLNDRSIKIPFYIGFVSGKNDSLPLGQKVNKESNERWLDVLGYDTPKCFDGIEIFTIKDNSLKRKRSFTGIGTSDQEDAVTVVSK